MTSNYNITYSKISKTVTVTITLLILVLLFIIIQITDAQLSGATLQTRIESETITSPIHSFTISIHNPTTGEQLLTTTGTGGTITIPTNTLVSGSTYDIYVKSPKYLRQKYTTTITNNQTTILPRLLAGDLNDDGIINIGDWNVMSSAWFSNNTNSDINNDGIVNTADFAYISKNLNQVNAPLPTQTTPTSQTHIYRINSGGPIITDPDGNEWQADQYAINGNVVTRTTVPIANTTNDSLYLYERYSTSGYNLPVGTGTYTVKLHFAETWPNLIATGQRIFNVSVENSTLLNLDIYAETGGRNIALIKTFNVSVLDGTLNIILTPVISNAIINGIEVIQTSGTLPSVTPVTTVTLIASPTSVAYNGSATLSWSSTNATSCTNNFNSSTATNGTYYATNLTYGRTYTTTCTGTGGSTSDSTSVTVAQQIIIPPISGIGTSINLGNLNIPRDRIPQWYPPTEAEAGYNSAKSWPEYDVTCSTAPCASGKNPYTNLPSIASYSRITTSDFSNMDEMGDNAPDNVVLYIPAGVYNINSNQAISLTRSNIVIRGSGMSSTILKEMSGAASSACSGIPSNAISICNSGFDGSAVSWTSGYDVGTRNITLSNTSSFSVGGWIDLDMDSETVCEFVDESHADMFHHRAKITAINGNTLTIDRGLRMKYDGSGCTGFVARPFNPLTNIGIENIGFTSDESVNRADLEWHVGMHGTVNSWLIGNSFGRGDVQWVMIRFSARIWVQGNNFDDMRDVTYSIEGMSGKDGTTDIVWENNICTNSRTCQMFYNGAEGIISSYNFFRQNQSAHSSGGCERAFQIHGHYVREILIEGNDVNCAIQMADKYWGRNGERSTAYRNRNTANTCIDSHNYISVDYSGGPEGIFNSRYLNILGNAVGRIGSNWASCDSVPLNNNGIADWAQDVWIEKNFWRDNRIIDPVVGNLNGRSCGVSAEDSCPGTNVNNSPIGSSSWTGNYPISLYRTSKPSWWCQETVSNGGQVCDWDARGIGAFGDNFNGTLCKLPAQVRFEGGTCTTN